MKQRKRVLMSLAMLLVSAIMLSSASYAWFSMNTEVEVEGIEFVAYSDSLFLEISKDNQTFTPNDIQAELTKKYLRPIAFGTVDDMGGALSVVATPATGRFDSKENKLYYREVTKADTNDTAYGEVDYYCVNEELRDPSSTNGLYIEGAGITFNIVTTDTAAGDLFERVGNNYIAKTLAQNESAYGYYTVTQNGACGTDDTYSPANKYYEHRDGNWYLAGGLDEGSHLEGYFTLSVSPATVAPSSVYYLKSAASANDAYPDYIAFKTAAENSNKANLPEQGYWYRGYSENIDLANPDGQSDRINGVIVDGKYTNENTPYYLHTTYYLRMATASNLAENLRVNSIEVIGSENANSLTDAVRVMLVVSSSVQKEEIRIVYNNGTGEFTRDDKSGRITSGDTTLFYERFLGDTNEIVTVQVYLYYDGTDTVVNTNNDLDFSGHTVNIEFGIDAPDYLK